ncbi:unnamed protein product [Durusdinium trenchii]|uniref:Uncharacterized protein n=1 Tax=Durusdinium trenchii TaxID=1381693 RepID=A0ABP0JAR2_9DINO
MTDAFSTAWLVEGADVERELDDIGNIWIRGRVSKTDGRQLADLEYFDGSTEIDVPASDLRPLLPVFVPPPRRPAEVTVLNRASARYKPNDQPDPPQRENASLRQRIADLRAEAGLLDQSVQHLRVRQDLGLAALESANSSVAEARSGLNQRMSCANECLSEIMELVNEIKVTLGDAACSAGFRDLAVLNPHGEGAKIGKIKAENHEVIEAWVPVGACDAPGTTGAAHTARCAISSTLRLSGYPWPSVLETTVTWVRHHTAIGFAPIILFLDEPDLSKEEALMSLINTLEADMGHGMGELVRFVGCSQMQAAWREHGPLWEEFGSQSGSELSANLGKGIVFTLPRFDSRKQILNCATATEYCRASGCAEWLLCNLDLDEAVCFSSPGGSSGVAEHFSAVGDISQIVYINHEAIVAEADKSGGATWFEHIQHFKISPVLKLPFMCRRFPNHDEEPQVLDHPEGTGEKTLLFWQRHNARLSEQYNFKKRSGGSTCSYFDGYMRGKVAVRVNALNDAVPRVHRWHGLGLQTVVCHPGAASILHYINCGGLDWFEAKYKVRGSEEANRLWFHVLAQERAKIGKDALKELYDDVLAIPASDLESQMAEGFVVPLNLASELKTFDSFWGWAVVGLGDELCVHMPLQVPPAPGAGIDMSLGQPLFHDLCPGEYIELDLHTESAEVPVLFLQVPPNQRGFLVLDIATTDILNDAGIFLCISCDDNNRPEFVAVSTASEQFSGWRCRVQAHRWPSSTVAVWVGCTVLAVGGLPLREHPFVSFEVLSESYESSTPKCRAHLRFEDELTLLPLELHGVYDIFHAAYKDVDGQALADEAGQVSSLELTYAEVEFAPFFNLLQMVAQPQPGVSQTAFVLECEGAIPGHALLHLHIPPYCLLFFQESRSWTLAVALAARCWLRPCHSRF